MREARDSFVHFLYDNLSGIPVTLLRFSKDAPNNMQFDVNAVNVSFISDRPSLHVGELYTVIDIIQEDELTAIDWMWQVYGLLRAAGYIPKLDYTNPSNPTAMGSNLMWGVDQVKFRKITNDFYFRYSATLCIKHTAA